MARLFFPLIVPIMIGAQLVATSASAQFGSIFGNEPPRPPQGVPRQQPPRGETPPPGLLPPGRPPQQPQGNIQTQPLPPPPGTTAAPLVVPSAPPGQPPISALPPGQRPPRATPPPPASANTALQPGDEMVAEPPAQKVPNPTGIFAGLDKITGRITSFDVAMNETVQFGALQVTPRACYTRPPTETPHTDAFIEVDEVTLQGEVRRIYTGWMFAASPGLHAVEHPIYDIWLTDCKGAAVAEAAPPAPPAPAQRTPSRSQQQQQQQPQPQQQRRTNAPL
jgi:hypothetical protein